jgi:hypothetical protein
MDIARVIADQMPLTIAVLLIFAGGYGMASGRDAFRIVTSVSVVVFGASLSVVFLGTGISSVTPATRLIALTLILLGLGLSVFFAALSAKRIRRSAGKKDSRIGGPGL